MAAKKIKVTLVRGMSRTTEKQKATIRGLGLSRKINNESILEINACVLGMINKVKHLVRYEEL